MMPGLAYRVTEPAFPKKVHFVKPLMLKNKQQMTTIYRLKP